MGMMDTLKEGANRYGAALSKSPAVDKVADAVGEGAVAAEKGVRLAGKGVGAAVAATSAGNVAKKGAKLIQNKFEGNPYNRKKELGSGEN